MRRNWLALAILCVSVCPMIGMDCAGTGLTDLVGGNVPPPDNTNPQDGGHDPIPGSSSMAVNDPSITGELVAGQQATITIQCSVAIQDGTLRSVEANLAGLNGDPHQALAHQAGDLWGWTGVVTPAAGGPCLVRILATDSQGQSVYSEVPAWVNTVVVVDPSNPPSDPGTNPGIPPGSLGPVFGSIGVGGDFGGLAAGRSCRVKLCCGVWPGTSGGAAVSVTADLGELGGQAGVPLDLEDKNDALKWTTWYKLVEVYPPTGGKRKVVFHATDGSGNTTDMTAEADVYPAN